MALLHRPRLLFRDAPFEGVDPSSSLTVEAMLSRLAREGVTVLFTSHNLAIVQRLASRVLILQRGSLIWDSVDHGLSGSLEKAYFDIAGAPDLSELTWIGS